MLVSEKNPPSPIKTKPIIGDVEKVEQGNNNNEFNLEEEEKRKLIQQEELKSHVSLRVCVLRF